MRQVAWDYTGMGSNSLWPTFGNEVGYFGYDTPAQLRNLGTDTQFCLMLSDSRGLYMGYHDQGQKHVVQICFFLAPAYIDSFNSSDVDHSGKSGDSSMGIDPNHLCFIQPGDSQRSEALVLEPFTRRLAWGRGYLQGLARLMVEAAKDARVGAGRALLAADPDQLV